MSGRKLYEYLVRALLIIATLALILMATIIAMNILGRTLFGKPVLGTIEIAGLAGVVFASIAVPFVEKEHRNVLVEVVVTRFPPRVKAFTDAFVLLVSLGVVGILTWAMFRESRYAASYTEVTTVMRIPIAPFKYVWSVGATLLSAVLLWNVIESVKKGLKR